MKKILLIGIFFASLSLQLFAQPAPAPVGSGTSPVVTAGIVKGKIVEAGTKTPMEYANVVIYSVRDSSIVGGIMTESDGSFQIKNVPPGKYYLQANFIGYEKHTLPGITINRSGSVADIGTLELKPASKELEGVDVVADKARVEYKLDRRVVNVSQEISAAGGSAVDALANTPAVDVDIEGNVSVRGSSDFTVLIDGKPSVLEGSDALKQIPASDIENIEVITNPSAKYDPDGVSGIINVVMKKHIKGSFSGVANVSTSNTNKNRGDLTLNYRSDKWTLMLGGDFQHMDFSGQRKVNQEFYNSDTTTVLKTEGNMDRIRTGRGLRGGVDYRISDNTTLSMSGRIGKYSFQRNSLSTQHTYDNYGLDEYIYEDNTSARDGNYWSSDFTYSHNFNKKGHQLITTFFTSGREGPDNEYQIRYPVDASGNPIDQNPDKIRTVESSNDNEYRINADYTLPINDANKFEAGYQARIDRETENYLFENYDYTASNWVNNPNFSSAFDFSRDIHALYTIWSHSTNSFSWQTGLRAEYTNRRMDHSASSDPYIIDRVDWFPSVHLSQKFGRDIELQSSYSRRISRPRGWDLEPFPSYMDQYNIRVGNPALEPEYTDSYELSVLKRINKSFISLEGYYRRTNNLITRIQELHSDGIIYHTSANMNRDHSLGSELMANLDLFPWLRIIASGTVFYYRLEGSVNGESVDKNSTNFNSRFTADVKFTPTTRFQLMSVYRGPTVSAQGEYKGMMYANASLKQELFNKKLSATLQVRDIFGTMKRSGTSYGDGFKTDFEFRREPRVFQLTLSYIINNYKSKSRNGNNTAPAEEDQGNEY